METPKTFRVGIRQKVPYLANLFLVISLLCFLVILAFQFLFSPFKSAGQEMQAAVFFWVVPEFWKKVFVVSGIGFCVTALGYRVMRCYKPAILLFSEDEIIMRGKGFKEIFPIKTIRKIYCNDARTMDGESKERFSIIIEQKKKRKAIAIRLKNYGEVDEFMEQLTKYESIEFKFYDFTFNPMHIGEK